MTDGHGERRGFPPLVKYNGFALTTAPTNATIPDTVTRAWIFELARRAMMRWATPDKRDEEKLLQMK